MAPIYQVPAHPELVEGSKGLIELSFGPIVKPKQAWHINNPEFYAKNLAGMSDFRA